MIIINKNNKTNPKNMQCFKSILQRNILYLKAPKSIHLSRQ